MFPVVFFDDLRVKFRHEAVVRSKAVYLAFAVLPYGTRDILAVWIEQTECAKIWLKVFTDTRQFLVPSSLRPFVPSSPSSPRPDMRQYIYSGTYVEHPSGGLGV
jgi:hypothetical protein